MHGPQIEKLLFGCPIFHQLRRQFDEITVNVRSRQGRITAAGQHPVQRMTELVEQGRHLIESKQGGLPVGRFRKVAHDRDQRTNLAALFDILRPKLGHPCSAALRGPREIIHIQHGEECSVAVAHFECPHIGMINRNVRIFVKGQPIEFTRQQECTVLYVLKPEIRLQLLLVERIPGALEPLLPIAVVPRHQLVSCPRAAGKVNHFAHVTACRDDRPFEQFIEKLPHALRSPGHPFFQYIIGIGRIAQQIGQP